MRRTPRSVDKPDGTPRSRLRLRSPAGLLLLGAGLLILLGLVAAVSRAHHTPGGHSGVHAVPTGVGDYLFSIVLLLFAGLVCLLLWAWFSQPDLPRRRRSRRGSLAVFVVLALLALASTRLDGLLGRGNHKPQNLQLGQHAKARPQRRSGEEAAPHFKWLPVFVATAAGLTALGVIGVRSLRRSRRGLAESLLLEREFEGLLDDTLADLYAESDPRKAIIAAYARVERLFATYGLPRAPPEAPVEYLERVLPELHASGAALGRLTALFQWAKFSAHDVDRLMRDEAIDALVEVRGELRANRLEDEPRPAVA
jgi:hypothetical protein